MKKNNNKKGFTVVELVIVIAVIAILAAVLIPTFSNVIEKANNSAVLQEARYVYTEVYAVDIADGTLEASGNGTMSGGNYTYTAANGKFTAFTFTKDGLTATLNTSTGEFTVAPATTPAS